MWPSDKELMDLSFKLGLPVQGDEPDWDLQDWEWDFADSHRIEDFIKVYNQEAITNNQKTALMALIVESYDVFLHENMHL